MAHRIDDFFICTDLELEVKEDGYYKSKLRLQNQYSVFLFHQTFNNHNLCQLMGFILHSFMDLMQFSF